MHSHIFRQKERPVTLQKKVAFVQMYLDQYNLKQLLYATKLSKSSYFNYLKKAGSLSKTQENMAIRRQVIKTIFYEFKEIYGARKIKVELEKQQIHVSVRTVTHDLKLLNLKSCYVKKYRPKRSSSTDENCVNLLLNETVTRPHTHIATDITYLQTRKDDWVYQLTFMDLYTRKVLHFDVARKMDSYFVNSNTEKLLKKYPDIKMIHSDRGSQYTANSYRKLLAQYKCIPSYSAKGYPYHNAVIESYHAALKREWFYRLSLKDMKEVYIQSFKYNYGFYNTKRIHQSLGYMTPNAFEINSLGSV